jgi:serine/threonine-protein kinase RsbW
VSGNTSTVSLELDSRPQSVALVRGMLSAVFELVGLGPELRDDVNSAASEACNNVILHAYGDHIGPLDVGVELGAENLVVVVRDRGVGIAARTPMPGRLGVGMAMMSTLATRAEFIDGTGGGTEARLTFACDAPWPPAARTGPQPSLGQLPAALSGDAVIRSCPTSLVAAVMGRLSMMVAAGARFSLDGLADLRLLTDAICAQAMSSGLSERIGFALAGAVRRLELVVGPFRPGTRDEMERVDWASEPSYLPLRLADELKVETVGECEIVRAVITDCASRTASRG